jgi:hypothetical protein
LACELSGLESAFGSGLLSTLGAGLFSGFESDLTILGSSRPTGVGTGEGRSTEGVLGRGSGRFTRGGAEPLDGGAGAGGAGVVVVVGAGSVGAGFDEAPGFPGGGSGVVLETVGGVPPAGRLSGAGAVGIVVTGVCFPLGALGLRRE